MMVDYFRPRSLDEALALRASRPLQILAGGTDVYPARTTRAGWGATRHPDVLDISAIPDLHGIQVTSAGWRIGAMTTWTQLVRAELPALFDGLKAAAREVGGMQIQNRGTLAGNICNASPAADGVPCLLTLDAQVELAAGEQRRRVALADFIDNYRHTVIRCDEIVTAIHVPRQSGTGHFRKLGARRYLVISIAMVAGCLEVGDDGTIAAARIAVGSCSAVAMRLGDLERDLTGQAIADAPRIVAPRHFSHLTPIDDVRATGPFRAHAAVTLTRDLLGNYAAQTERAA